MIVSLKTSKDHSQQREPKRTVSCQESFVRHTMPTLLHLALQIAAQCAGSKCGNWPMFYSSLFAANSLQIVYSTIVPCTWLTWQYKTGLTIKQRIAPRLTPLAVNLTAMLRVVSSSDSAWCCLSTDVDSEALTAHNSFSAGFAVLRQCLGSA